MTTPQPTPIPNEQFGSPVWMDAWRAEMAKATKVGDVRRINRAMIFLARGRQTAAARVARG